VEVYPDEELRVVAAERVDNNDYASLFGDGGRRGGGREIETGFKNTALLGSAGDAGAGAGGDGDGAAGGSASDVEMEA